MAPASGSGGNWQDRGAGPYPVDPAAGSRPRCTWPCASSRPRHTAPPPDRVVLNFLGVPQESRFAARDPQGLRRARLSPPAFGIGRCRIAALARADSGDSRGGPSPKLFARGRPRWPGDLGIGGSPCFVDEMPGNIPTGRSWSAPSCAALPMSWSQDGWARLIVVGRGPARTCRPCLLRPARATPKRLFRCTPGSTAWTARTGPTWRCSPRPSGEDVDLPPPRRSNALYAARGRLSLLSYFVQAYGKVTWGCGRGEAR